MSQSAASFLNFLTRLKSEQEVFRQVRRYNYSLDAQSHSPEKRRQFWRGLQTLLVAAVSLPDTPPAILRAVAAALGEMTGAATPSVELRAEYEHAESPDDRELDRRSVPRRLNAHLKNNGIGHVGAHNEKDSPAIVTVFVFDLDPDIEDVIKYLDSVNKVLLLRVVQLYDEKEVEHFARP